MNGTYFSQQVGNTCTYASLQPGLYLYNASVDGQYLMARDVGTNNPTSLHNSDALFAANLLSITRNATDLWEADCQLNNGAVNLGRFQPYDQIAPFAVNGSVVDPTCQVSQFVGRPSQPMDPDFYYTGISTLTSKDMSRKLTGTDFKGKQIVVHLRRHNAVPSTAAPQIYHSVLHVGCKIILENGQLRREC